MVSSGGFLLSSAIEFPEEMPSVSPSGSLFRKKGEQDSLSALMPRIRFDWYRICCGTSQAHAIKSKLFRKRKGCILKCC